MKSHRPLGAFKMNIREVKSQKEEWSRDNFKQSLIPHTARNGKKTTKQWTRIEKRLLKELYISEYSDLLFNCLSLAPKAVKLYELCSHHIECSQVLVCYYLLSKYSWKRQKGKRPTHTHTQKPPKLSRENHSFYFGSDMELLGRQHC